MGSYLVVFPVAVFILMLKVNQSWKVIAGPAEKLAAIGASQTMVRFFLIEYL